MRKFIERICDAFYPTELRKKVTDNYRIDTEEISRKVVSTVSSGNLNLQLGRYITSEQMDKYAASVYGSFTNKCK